MCRWAVQGHCSVGEVQMQRITYTSALLLQPAPALHLVTSYCC